jgi:hypothetical protein
MVLAGRAAGVRQPPGRLAEAIADADGLVGLSFDLPMPGASGLEPLPA